MHGFREGSVGCDREDPVGLLQTELKPKATGDKRAALEHHEIMRRLGTVEQRTIRAGGFGTRRRRRSLMAVEQDRGEVSAQRPVQQPAELRNRHAIIERNQSHRGRPRPGSRRRRAGGAQLLPKRSVEGQRERRCGLEQVLEVAPLDGN